MVSMIVFLFVLLSYLLQNILRKEARRKLQHSYVVVFAFVFFRSKINAKDNLLLLLDTNLLDLKNNVLRFTFVGTFFNNSHFKIKSQLINNQFVLSF